VLPSMSAEPFDPDFESQALLTIAHTCEFCRTGQLSTINLTGLATATALCEFIHPVHGIMKLIHCTRCHSQTVRSILLLYQAQINNTARMLLSTWIQTIQDTRVLIQAEFALMYLSLSTNRVCND
jgi:hypothetical protein